MKTTTEKILMGMNVLAWIAYIGFMIKAGAIMVSYGVALYNPEASVNLYKSLDVRTLREFSFWQYTIVTANLVAMAVIQSYIAQWVIQVLTKIKLSSPFTIEVSALLERISYAIFAMWACTMIYNAHVGWLRKHIPDLELNFISGEFIFLAGVVFVMSQIFKKGVELQSENDLTV